MRVVLDTNVFASGDFFSGPPNRILGAWRDGRIVPVISAEILQEYRRVGEILSRERSTSSLEPFLALLAMNSEIVIARPLAEQVSQDASDDAFLACALAANVNVIVSGDRHLLTVSPWGGIHVLTPRKFLDERLGGS